MATRIREALPSDRSSSSTTDCETGYTCTSSTMSVIDDHSTEQQDTYNDIQMATVSGRLEPFADLRL